MNFKNLIFYVIILIVNCTTNVMAQNKDKDIVMVSYEQSPWDYDGTLSLKNNTDVEVENINFTILYFDMSGKQLDYKDFFKHVSIAPGMTKKIDIPAYEHSRHYHYYKTKDQISYMYTAFDIKFKLNDYNVRLQETNEDFVPLLSPEETYNESIWSGFGIYIVLFLLFISITVGTYVLVAVMAQQRNLNVIGWILLSFVLTPITVCIILLCIKRPDKNEPPLYHH